MAVADFFGAGRQHANVALTPRQCDRLSRAAARSSGGAIAESGDDQWTDTDQVQGGLHRGAIGGVADQPLPDQRIGQSGNRCVAIDLFDRLVEVPERKAIAANADDSGRRTGHGDRPGGGIDAAGVAGSTQPLALILK